MFGDVAAVFGFFVQTLDGLIDVDVHILHATQRVSPRSRAKRGIRAHFLKRFMDF